MIQIKKATLSNFRSKTNLDISLGNRLTLLAGENGSGKTTLLDGLAIGLGAVFSRFPNVKGLGFKNEDLKKEAKQTAPYARIALETLDGLRWDKTLRRDQSRQTIGLIPEGVGLTNINHYIDENFLNPYN
ncbi:ATP-binding protein, partial [Geofilum rubicundum]|uniref:ATP-binding protein n=1 Tax=Geofilum rubicundum TaxID=472113 RepID=UPI0012FBA5F3